MLASERARLAADQHALVAALVDGGPIPPGFDPARVAAAAEALARKRGRQVAKSFPALARSLGDDFVPRFVDYAAGSPLPAGGAQADGLEFTRHVFGRRVPREVAEELRSLSGRRWFRRPGRRAAGTARRTRR